MALLKAGKLAAEISLDTMSHPGFVYYNFMFTYAGKPLFNPAIKFNKVVDYDIAEKLAGFFEQASQLSGSGDSAYWFVAGDWVYIQATLFYAEGFESYLDGPDDPSINDMPKEKELKLKQLDLLRKKKGGILPGDLIEISFSIFDDKLLFSGDLFSGSGPGVRLLVRRSAVKRMATQVQQDFRDAENRCQA